MTLSELLLGSGVPDLRALGAERLEHLSGDARGLEGFEQAELVARERGSELWRYPLPGTPGADGRLNARPRGAGTGWLFLRRYRRCSWREFWRARFTHPRSLSLAAREWNLICHLRAAGVGTPEPLAVGSLGGAPLARRSFIVTRELEGLLPLSEWWSETPPEERRAGVKALGLCLARLFASGTHLPRLSARHVYLSPGPMGAGPVGAGPPEPGSGCDESRAPLSARAPALALRRLPEVALTGLLDGRILAALPLQARLALLARLQRETAGLQGLGRLDRLGVFQRALGRGLERAERRSALQELERPPRELERPPR